MLLKVDPMSEYASSEGAEGGGPLAWRVFVALEGGALLVAALGLIARAARPTPAPCTEKTTEQMDRTPHILIPNEITYRGRFVVEKLRSSGCRVSSLATASGSADRADALVVFGTQPTSHGLDGLAAVMSNELSTNITIVGKARDHVRPGGCLVWVSGEAMSGSFEGSAAAFEDVLRAQLRVIADDAKCEAVWIDRGDPMSQAMTILAAVLTSVDRNRPQPFDYRSSITRLTLVLWRWLKRLTWHV